MSLYRLTTHGDVQDWLNGAFDLLIFLCSLIQTLTLTPPPNNALLANMNVYRHMLASFPGPTQLSVACSMRGKSPGTRVAMCMALSSFLGLVQLHKYELLHKFCTASDKRVRPGNEVHPAGNVNQYIASTVIG